MVDNFHTSRSKGNMSHIYPITLIIPQCHYIAFLIKLTVVTKEIFYISSIDL